MAISSFERRNPTEALIERFGEIIDEGARAMDAEQLGESETKFVDIIDRAVAKKRHRETK